MQRGLIFCFISFSSKRAKLEPSKFNPSKYVLVGVALLRVRRKYKFRFLAFVCYQTYEN